MMSDSLSLVSDHLASNITVNPGSGILIHIDVSKRVPPSGVFSTTSGIQPGEVVLLLVVLVSWCAAVAFFVHRWRFIRILQPSEPRYRHCPKNLERVKVVAKHRDSVIYKNYSENMSRTLMARQKRLDRMNTMPNMKVCEDAVAAAAATAAAAAAGNAAFFSSARPRSESDLQLERGTVAVSFRHLAESCTSFITGLHMNVISPVMEVEEGSDANVNAVGIICTNV